jgi:FMN phosphatase YigB (HAD superfamily)
MGEIRNIIFDFGGVVLHIDYQRTIDAFKKLGVADFDDRYSKLQQSTLFDDLEKGLIAPQKFCQQLKSLADSTVTDDQIVSAWNAMLLDLPAEHVHFLKKIKTNYRIFLLSNTNEIHEHAFTKMIMEKFGTNVLTENFEHVYFSHHLHLRKPNVEIFNLVVRENKLIPDETLFIDDSIQHIEGAKKAGLKTFYFDKGKTLDDVGKYLLNS